MGFSNIRSVLFSPLQKLALYTGRWLKWSFLIICLLISGIFKSHARNIILIPVYNFSPTATADSDGLYSTAIAKPAWLILNASDTSKVTTVESLADQPYLNRSMISSGLSIDDHFTDMDNKSDSDSWISTDTSRVIDQPLVLKDTVAVRNENESIPSFILIPFMTNSSPVFTSTPVTTVNENATYSYEIAFSDADEDDVTVTATTLPGWLTLTSTPEGNRSTLAGSGTETHADGTGTEASFYGPVGLALDPDGNTIVMDQHGYAIRKVTPDGVTSTVSGGSFIGGRNGDVSVASFNHPKYAVINDAGDIFLTESSGQIIRKISTDGIVTTVAGGNTGTAFNPPGYVDGTGLSARFDSPQGIAIDEAGILYVYDRGNRRIRKITQTGVVTTLSGSGNSGDTDGAASVASFGPSQDMVYYDGFLYLVEPGNQKIRKISVVDGSVSTFAGSGTRETIDGTGTGASFKSPLAIAVDSNDGTLYVTEQVDEKIRRITQDGVVTTIAGSGASLNPDGSVIQYNFPSGIIINNEGNLVVAERTGRRIRVVTLEKHILEGSAVGQTGTHNVALSLSDGSGGTAQQNFVVEVKSPLVASSSVSTEIDCNGDSGAIAASATGGSTPFTYAWSSGETTAVNSGQSAGTYTVTIADATGATSVSSVTLTEPTALTASASMDSNVSCNGGTDGAATAVGSGGTGTYTYAWSNGATTASVTGLATGTFTVSITDANGCGPATKEIIVTEPTALVASASVDSNVSCNGGTDGGATAQGSGGTGVYTYAWSNGGTTATVTGLEAGTFTVSITDANGCGPATKEVTVTEPTALGVSIAAQTNVSLFGGTDGGATAQGSGGTGAYTYAWSNGATTAAITGIAAGTYTVSVTDANGCNPAAEAVTITQPANQPPVITSASAVNFAENETIAAYTITSTDAESQNVNYLLGAGNDEALFNISNGVVSFKNPPDFESPDDGNGDNEYEVEVIANDGNSLVKQLVTITVSDVDEINPEVLNVSASNDDTYIIGEELTVTLAITEPVTVDLQSGSPFVNIIVGNTFKQATYKSNSGNSIVFGYTVTDGDEDTNGIAIHTLSLNGSQIEDATGNTLITTLNNVVSTSGIRVDGIRPTITNVSVGGAQDRTYGVGGILSVAITFSEGVTVIGGGWRLNLDFDSGVKTAQFSSQLSQTGWSIRYFIEEGDLASDLAYTDQNALSFVSGTVRDANGNAANLTLPVPGTPNSLSFNKNIKVDGVRPVMQSGVTASFAENGTGTAYIVMATDTNPVTYSLGTGNDESLFNILDGAVTFKTSPDFENPVDGDANNSYLINVIAMDANNNSVNQDVTITVTDTDEIAPTVVLTASTSTPVAGAYTVTAQFSEDVTGFVLADIAVSGGTASNFATIDANTYTFSVGSGGDAADVSVGASLAEDLAGNANVKSNTLSLVFDVTAPDKPVITHITDDTGSSDSDGVTNDTNIIISGTAEALSMVELFSQYGPIRSTQTNANGNWVLDVTDITLVQVEVNLTAEAVDLAGNRSATSDIFVLKPDFRAPAKPVITHITDDTGSSDSDGVTNDTNIIISGTAEALSTLELFSQYGPIRSTQTDANGNWVLDVTDITLVQVEVNLTAEAVDLAGNRSATSDIFVLKPDFRAPAKPVITHITDDTGSSDSDGVTNDTNIIISGTAEALSTVELFSEYGPIRSTQTDANGNWVLDVTDITLVQIEVNLTAEAVDLAGNRSAASNIFVLKPDFRAPDVFIDIDHNSVAGYTVTALFNEEIIGLTLNGITVIGGTASNLVQLSPSSYTFLVSLDGSTADVIINAGMAEDLAGNGNTASNQLSLGLTEVANGEDFTNLRSSDKTEEIRVYPNPASSVLTFDLSELSAEKVDIYMYDAAGVPVFKREAYKQKILQLDVSDYTSGLYIVQFYDGITVVRRKVMVKK